MKGDASLKNYRSMIFFFKECTRLVPSEWKCTQRTYDKQRSNQILTLDPPTVKRKKKKKFITKSIISWSNRRTTFVTLCTAQNFMWLAARKINMWQNISHSTYIKALLTRHNFNTYLDCIHHNLTPRRFILSISKFLITWKLLNQ